jgi:hypothetical protein
MRVGSAAARTAVAAACVCLALAPSGVHAQDCGGEAGPRLVPNVCVLARASEEVARADALRPAACVALGRGPAAARVCAMTEARPRCDAGADVEAWIDAWQRAASSTWAAWEGRPLLHLDVLERAREVLDAHVAWATSCGVAPRSPPEWSAYLELARRTTSLDGLCEDLDALVGPEWSGARARWMLSPLRRALAESCPNVRERSLPSFERADRAREIAERMLASVADLEGPTIADEGPVADERLRAATCARLPYFLGARGAAQARETCGGTERWSAPPLCEDESRCSLSYATQRGAHGLARWARLVGASDARGVVARELSARASRSTRRSSIADRSLPAGDLELTGRARRSSERCVRLAHASDRTADAPIEALTMQDVRVLLASARCRGTGATDERRIAARELSRVREAAVHAPAVRRSPDAVGVAATAGLLLLSTPGHQAAGREMVRPILDAPDAFTQIARVVAGGGAIDDDVRRSTAWIATRALGRLAEVAIDEREPRLASEAIDAMEAFAEGAPVDGRERELQRVERALLRATSAIERGELRQATLAVEDARELLATRAHGTRGYRRQEHEVRARAIALGLEEGPSPSREPARGCETDFVRRGLVRESMRADSAERRRALDAALQRTLDAEPVSRGPCTRARGFREAEVEAALARVRLRSQCLDEGDAWCLADAEGTVRATSDALLAAVAAFERAVDDRRVDADVVRTRPLERLAQALRVEAAHATDDARTTTLLRAGASRAGIERLRWIAFSAPSCVAYPDLRVQLHWLAGRDVPACAPLEGPPRDSADEPDRASTNASTTAGASLTASPSTTAAATLAFVRHGADDAGDYVAWWRHGTTLKRRAIAARGLEREVDALVRALSDPLASYRDELDATLATVLGPFRDALRALPRGAEVTVVPDAALAALPFALLFDAMGRSDLRVRHALDVAPLPDEPEVRAREPALVLADPRFGPSDGAVGLTRLPGTRAEADALCALYACDSRRLEREGATERALFGAVQELTGSWGVVHLATHAVFSGTDAVADRSAILLAGVGDELPEPPTYSSENDGMLDERELAGLGLAYTRIVVLSACGTSRGRARLGVRGLVRAARLSGARSVLGSLWSVDDTATSAWMSAFYAHLARGEGAATSARAAADAVRARWAHPYYWAPFVLIEARPTESLPNVGQRRRG